MSISNIIAKYAELSRVNSWSYSKTASILLKENPDINISHRTLRRRFSQTENKMNTELDRVSIIEELDKNTKEFNYTGEKSLTSKEDAVKFFKIDLSKEEIYKSIFNSWDVTLKDKSGNSVKRTNYQVKLFARPIEKKISTEDIEKVISKVNFEKYKNFNNSATGIGVACITDIHVGEATNVSKGLVNTKEFNSEILIDYLAKIAQDINNKNKKEVHVAILGDIISSFTGLNHVNSWQELEMYGSNALISAYKILSNFLHSIKNVKRVYIVTGNHDRSTSNKEEDKLGNVTSIVSFMLSKEFDVLFKPLVVSQVIDDISYVFTHGHFGISKQLLAKIILDYGNQNYYNVVCQGHLHSRQSKKEFFRQEYTHMDSVNYRGITVAPVFTGNFYAESFGWTSSSGYSFLEANHNKSNINHFDISI
jgi:predicted phosphodiesterase